jgi:hypothetical protein
MHEKLYSLLQGVASGTISPEVAYNHIKDITYEAVGNFALVDHHRSLRTGVPEVVFGIGKTPEQIAEIMTALHRKAMAPVVMATKISPDTFTKISQQLPHSQYFPTAQICSLGQPQPQQRHARAIAVVSAGTADLPIAEEAAITLELSGFCPQRLWDVGVAGIHRLFAHRHIVEGAKVIIVVAGMEGALPSVVAGLVSCPVIAVPTSIGYGCHLQGLTPLLTMLNSCSAGIAVVNIDNGFGAAMLAIKILGISAD